jgi:hypothetical protein
MCRTRTSSTRRLRIKKNTPGLASSLISSHVSSCQQLLPCCSQLCSWYRLQYIVLYVVKIDRSGQNQKKTGHSNKIQLYQPRSLRWHHIWSSVATARTRKEAFEPLTCRCLATRSFQLCSADRTRAPPRIGSQSQRMLQLLRREAHRRRRAARFFEPGPGTGLHAEAHTRLHRLLSRSRGTAAEERGLHTWC